MYIGDLDPPGLGHLGKKKRWKKLTKKITKIAKPVVRAAAAYYTGGASEAAYAKIRAAKKKAAAAAADPGPPPELLPPPEAAPPPPRSATEAITSAARNWFASRLPRPAPSQPSSPYYPETEAAEGQPVTAGFGALKLSPKVLLAGAAIGIPLLFIVLREPRGGRR